MAVLQAARAHVLGLPPESAKSWALNRANFITADKRGFKAGASYFGVSDAEALAKDTHKFESRYLDTIIAPYPEGKEVYYARSPIHFVDRISSTDVYIQWMEDFIVPPSQAELMVGS